jgi:hypothetical protein
MIYPQMAQMSADSKVGDGNLGLNKVVGDWRASYPSFGSHGGTGVTELDGLIEKWNINNPRESV